MAQCVRGKDNEHQNVRVSLFRADLGTNLFKQWENITSAIGSITQSSHGQREALGLSPGQATSFFLLCDIWWLSVGSLQGQRASKCACLVVPPLLRADSGRIFLSGEISKVGHWLNNSVVSRIARGLGFESRPGHEFFLPCDTRMRTW